VSIQVEVGLDDVEHGLLYPYGGDFARDFWTYFALVWPVFCLHMDLTGLASADTRTRPCLGWGGDGIDIPMVFFAVDPSKTGPCLPDVFIGDHP